MTKLVVLLGAAKKPFEDFFLYCTVLTVKVGNLEMLRGNWGVGGGNGHQSYLLW